MTVIKRDGTEVVFNSDKIRIAIMQAGARVKEIPKEEVIRSILCDIDSSGNESITINSIQSIIETNLAMYQPNIGKTYTSYRKARDFARRRSSNTNKEHLDNIVHIKGGNFVNENANMAGSTPAGQMMKFASLASTDYAYDHLVPEKFLKLHDSGDIHIHDLDYYACKTRTCVQYDLEDILSGGFWAKKAGWIEEPQRIGTYADLAAIVFQTHQNLDHGYIMAV